MNIEIPPSQSRPGNAHYEMGLVDFAASLIDDTLTLPRHPASRTAALTSIGARIESHFRRLRPDIAHTCALVSLILDAPITERELRDEQTLSRDFPEVREMLELVVYYGRRAAAGNRAAPSRIRERRSSRNDVAAVPRAESFSRARGASAFSAAHSAPRTQGTSHTSLGLRPPSFQGSDTPRRSGHDRTPLDTRASDHYDLDADFAMALQLQESEDDALQIDHYGSTERSSPAAAVQARQSGSIRQSARRDDAIPEAFINPSTGAVFNNPIFDTMTQSHLDGPSEPSAQLPAGHVRDHVLRGAVETWQQNQTLSRQAMGEALKQALMCSITQEMFTDPVIAADGYTYDREAICHWLAGSEVSPQTRQPLTRNHLWPARLLLSLMREYDLLMDSTPSQSEAQSPYSGRSEPQSVARQTGRAPQRASGDRGAAVENEELLRDLRMASEVSGIAYEPLRSRYERCLRLSASDNASDRTVCDIVSTYLIYDFNAYVDVLRGRRTKGIVCAWLSDCYRLKGDYTTASIVLERGLFVEPGSSALRLRRALLYLITDQTELVEFYLATPVRCSEDRNYRDAILGELSRRSGHYTSALNSFSVVDAEGYGLPQVAAWRQLALRCNSLPYGYFT